MITLVLLVFVFTLIGINMFFVISTSMLAVIGYKTEDAWTMLCGAYGLVFALILLDNTMPAVILLTKLIF